MHIMEALLISFSVKLMNLKIDSLRYLLAVPLC